MQRYDSYKDSGEQWLGRVPSHWDIKRLGSYFLERKVKVSDKEYAPLSVTKNGILPQLDNVAKSNDNDNRKLVKAGDFVINSRSDRKGSSGVSMLDGSVSLINLVLQPRNGIIPSFCNYLLKSYPFVEEYYRNGRGIVADLWTTRYDEMKSIKLAMPPIAEQKRMVEFLDVQTAQIDEGIAQQQKMIDLLNERKQIIINNAVTKGLTPDVPMKDSGVEWIGMIPEHWEVMPLKRVGSMSKGLTFTKADIVDEGYPAISYGQVHSKINTNTHIIEDLIRYVPKSFTKKCETSFAQQGDFIFADTSEDYDGCGNCVYNDTENGVYGGYHTIVLKTKFRNCKYIAYLCKTDIWRYQIRSRVSGVKVYSITQGILSQVGILFPPLSEQNRMVQYLDAQTAQIDEAIAQQQKMIDLLNERKQIIINEVVTGKIKV